VVGQDSLVATAAYRPEPEAAAAARHFVRETLQAWQGSGLCAGRDELVDDAVLLTSELVTNAVVHAGTSVQVMCRLADESVEIAVVDYRPVRLIPDEPQDAPVQAEHTNGRGLRLPAELASSWGVTYAPTCKAVWVRLGVTDAARSGSTWPGLDELERGRQERVRFLAEAGDLLAASLDTRKILVLGGQLAITRFAAWCAVFLAEGDAAPWLAYAAHAEPSRTAALDWLLRRSEPCAAPQAQASGPGSAGSPAAQGGWRLPLSAGLAVSSALGGARTGRGGAGRGDAGRGGAGRAAGRGAAPEMPPGAAELATDQAWCFPLVTASRKLGLLVIGSPGTGRLPGDVAEVAEGLARRIAVALDNCGPPAWHQFTAAVREPLTACR
jgi:anti-sigma regulatory factor (Ser/Thr protein kinase)